MRREFNNDYFYHIYNRGNDKRFVFQENKDFERFLMSMKLFNTNQPIGSLREHFERLERASSGPTTGSPVVGPLEAVPLVKIHAYCLNRNHFHLLLSQSTEKGISLFMKNIGAYTRYFNTKYNRSGSLFQGKYQYKEIRNTDLLLYISAYINGNAEIHKVSKAEKWPWSSYPDYIGKRNGTFCDKDIILSEFSSIEDYKQYVHEVIEGSAKIKKEYRRARLEEKEENEEMFKKLQNSK